MTAEVSGKPASDYAITPYGPKEGQLPLSQVIDLIEVLFGQFPHAKVDNPEVYIGAVASLLFDFPPEIVHRAVDPKRGLAVSFNYPPTLAQIKQWCETEMEPLRRATELEARRSEARRALPPPSQPRNTRPTLSQLKEKYGENWGLGKPQRLSEAVNTVIAQADVADDDDPSF